MEENQIEILVVRGADDDDHHHHNEQEDQYLCSFKERLKKASKLPTLETAKQSYSIIEVPKNVKEHHPSLFRPVIVSIGPYHHGDHRYQMMEEQKLGILNNFLDELEKGFKVGSSVLDHLYKAVKERENDIRCCYSHVIDKYNSSELTEMMVVDGCFILRLLCITGRVMYAVVDDPVLNIPWTLSSVTRDLLLLENQIPFFVLQILYDKSVSARFGVPPLEELILRLTSYSLPRYKTSQLLYKYNDFRGEHILDFYRSTLIPSPGIKKSTNLGGGIMHFKKRVCGLVGRIIQYLKRKEKLDMDEYDLVGLIQPAEKLMRAGIKFEAMQNANSFLDIDFNDGALKIPRLVTSDTINSLILNCIVFEQSYWGRSKHFVSYLNFMGQLIKTTSDAAYLQERNIIDNSFATDQELVNFFNEVSKNVPNYCDMDDHLVKVAKKVEIYCRNTRHAETAEFKRRYCGSVWIGLSASAAVLIILLTIVQTFYTVFGYYKS